MKTDWQTKKLGEVFQIERGGSPRPIEKFLTTDQDGINWIKIGDTKKVTKYIYKTEEKIKPSGLKKTRLVHDGDFILSNSMSFGRPYIMKTTGAIHDGWLVLREKLPGINRDFFYYLLGSPVVFDQFDKLAAGSTVRNLNTKLVSNVEVAFPSLTEQKQVVKTLDDIFEKLMNAKENAEKNLQNSKDLFESYLRDVFANPEKHWEQRTLREICDELSAGGDVPKGNFSKTRSEKYSIPIFANGVKDKGLYGYTNIKKIAKPSITVSARGTIGYSEIRREPFFPIVRLIVLIPNEKMVDLLFLYYIAHNFNFSNTGTSIPQLTIPMIENIKIALPPLEQQKTIVKKLNLLSVETKKLESIYEQKLANLEELKKSVLAKAFNAEL